MIINGYGVTLVRLQHDDIELVRQHRNSETVKQFMEFRNEISKADQEKWFASINNKFNNYFIIEFQNEKIGLIYGAEIDWQKRETGNGGIFIWEQKYLETSVPLSASLLLTEIAFLLGLQHTYIKVLRDNLRAVAFNRNLGYKILPDQENEFNQRYMLNSRNYFLVAERFRHSFVKLHGAIFTLTLDHPNDEAEKNIREIYLAQPLENKKRLNLIVA